MLEARTDVDLDRYPHPHHSRLIYKPGPGPGGGSDTDAGLSTPSRSLRPVARLPSRAFPPPSPTRTPPGSRTPESHDNVAGTGHAIALSSGVEPSEEVGYGVRNDGVDWKMMLRLGINWSVSHCPEGHGVGLTEQVEWQCTIRE